MSLQPILVNNKELGLSAYHSSLKTDYASGVSAIDIYDIAQFGVNKILCIGEYGNAGSEIIKTHASTAPLGNTVTLASALKKPHSKDTPVYVFSFDQLEFSHSDTLAGVKSVLGSIQNLDPAQDIMRYDDTSNTSGWYFTRYKNSITGIYSDYSDGIPYSGLPVNTVGYAIDAAMDDLGAKFSDLLTFDKLLRDAKQMLSLVRGKMKAWSKYQEYDYVVATVDSATPSYVMPATIYDKNSNRSVLSVRVEGFSPLEFIDREEYVDRTSTALGGDETGEPIFYSVWDGSIYLWPYGDVNTQSKNLLMDFYTDIETIDSQMDYIFGTKYDMLIPYLKWKIRAVTENNGKEDLKDPSYAEFRELLKDAMANDAGAERQGFRPRRSANRLQRDNSGHYKNI